MIAAKRLRADFNSLFGDTLCLSHDDHCLDEDGSQVLLAAGMAITVFDEDIDEAGVRDDLIASGVVQASPDWLQCKGSRWALKIDGHGVRHQSDLKKDGS